MLSRLDNLILHLDFPRRQRVRIPNLMQHIRFRILRLRPRKMRLGLGAGAAAPVKRERFRRHSPFSVVRSRRTGGGMAGVEGEHAADAAQDAFGGDFAEEEPNGGEVDGDEAKAGFEDEEVDGFGVAYCGV